MEQEKLNKKIEEVKILQLETVESLCGLVIELNGIVKTTPQLINLSSLAEVAKVALVNVSELTKW